MPDAPGITFTYLGHSTVRCDLADGRVVLIDPWTEGNPACPDELTHFDRLHAVLITHGHFDHMGDAVSVCLKYQPSQVIANFEIASWLGGQGVANCAPMNPGGTQEVCGMQVTMVPAVHSSGITDGDAILYGGVAGGYMVELPSGYTFYHAGDTALFSDMKLWAELHGPDLAMLPIGDVFTMDPLQAAHAVRMLGVSEVIPLHWNTFPMLTGRPEHLEEHLRNLGEDCRVVALEPGGRHTPA